MQKWYKIKDKTISHHFFTPFWYKNLSYVGDVLISRHIIGPHQQQTYSCQQKDTKFHKNRTHAINAKHISQSLETSKIFINFYRHLRQNKMLPSPETQVVWNALAHASRQSFPILQTTITTLGSNSSDNCFPISAIDCYTKY